MPRVRPFRCKQCGTRYVCARCPRCYPAKGKHQSGGRRGSGGGSRRVARPDMGRVLGISISVNIDAVPDQENSDA